MLGAVHCVRIAALGSIAGAVLLATVGCNGSSSFELPLGTPDCLTVCEMAWPCGAVLENDLDACIATCNDLDHEAYRACVYLNECDVMADCKLYAPTPAPLEVE